ncbi:MAG: SCO family protein [Methylococcaceae bacterium]|nr:SCO family protein [Prolixibacteraceae bacterium]
MKMPGYVLLITLFLVSCKNTDKKLPIIGRTTIAGQDTAYSAIRPFSFVSQDSTVVSGKTFDNKIYVADFIFLSCTSICPVMTHEMEKVYETYKTNPHVFFLSHTIDPENDTIPRLKEFAEALGVDGHKWFFVTGDKDSIYSMAENSYFATAYPDKNTPGNYIHSGGLLLVDTNKHIRGVYDGTNPKETDRLIADLKTLLDEQF